MKIKIFSEQQDSSLRAPIERQLNARKIYCVEDTNNFYSLQLHRNVSGMEPISARCFHLLHSSSESLCSACNYKVTPKLPTQLCLCEKVTQKLSTGSTLTLHLFLTQLFQAHRTKQCRVNNSSRCSQHMHPLPRPSSYTD